MEAISGGSAFVSYKYPDQLRLALEVAQSIALDNGAFSAWRSGNPVKDWSAFYDWSGALKKVPACDFAVIPDVIDGTESDNDFLVAEWPHGKIFGAPVWHMHESLARLERLASTFHRICIGSSGQFATVGDVQWWGRMADAMGVLCDSDGFPCVKIHGLRMLNPKVFTRLPLASADSTMIGRNINADKAWKGPYPPAGKPARARVLRQRIEVYNAPTHWAYDVAPLNWDSQLW